MDLEKFTKEICKTGFVLENRIAMDLKSKGWTLISNKYYEDDFEGSVREIDLLAYKVSKVKHLDVYTTLLISCKKNDQNIWALLARDINLKDPNADWWPLHAWSNDKPISYELSQAGQSRSYHDDLINLGVKEALSIPSVEVFAFQEMKRNGGAPQNDKNIFNAITSLMKAQAYELSALPQRRKSPAVYQFNLLSVVESDLVRLRFSGKDIDAEPIDSEHYIARYIIKKKESFSRVRFINASSFKSALEDYNMLHTGNCRWIEKTYEGFFDKVLKDWKRKNVLIDEFRSELKWTLLYRLELKYKEKFDSKYLDLTWKKDEDRLTVTLPASTEVFEFLNSDEKSREAVKEALKNIYHFTGDFYFGEDDIPF